MNLFDPIKGPYLRTDGGTGPVLHLLKLWKTDPLTPLQSRNARGNSIGRAVQLATKYGLVLEAIVRGLFPFQLVNRALRQVQMGCKQKCVDARFQRCGRGRGASTYNQNERVTNPIFGTLKSFTIYGWMGYG